MENITDDEYYEELDIFSSDHESDLEQFAQKDGNQDSQGKLRKLTYLERREYKQLTSSLTYLRNHEVAKHLYSVYLLKATLKAGAVDFANKKTSTVSKSWTAWPLPSTLLQPMDLPAELSAMIHRECYRRLRQRDLEISDEELPHKISVPMINILIEKLNKVLQAAAISRDTHGSDGTKTSQRLQLMCWTHIVGLIGTAGILPADVVHNITDRCEALFGTNIHWTRKQQPLDIDKEDLLLQPVNTRARRAMIAETQALKKRK